VFKGEQLTLNRFALPKEQGIRAELKGNQRALQVPGTSDQVLAGTLVVGDRVDVVALLKDPRDNANVQSAIALRNLRVLALEDSAGGSGLDRANNPEKAVILAVTDAQAQRLYYVMKNGDWTLQLRPVKKPSDSRRSTDTFATVLAGGAR